MGWVKALSPVVLGIAKRNPAAGKIAYNALAGTTKVGKAVGKSLPIVGAGLTAYGASASYNDAINRGEDPGRAAFKGIGETVGGVVGGIGGGTLAGPVGTVGGYLGGNYVGGKIASAIYDAAGGGYDQPVKAGYTVEEQREMRRQIAKRRAAQNNANQSGMYDIGGFRYSAGADPTLVGLRMQQQAQNINAVQGYSTAKHLSNNQLKSTLGQQATDRYGMGQMGQTERLAILQGNITERYGIGRKADVENNRIRGDVQLGLGQQYTERYGIGRKADVENNRIRGDVQLGLGQQHTQRYLGGRQADNDRYGLETQRQLGTGEIGLKKYDLEQGYGIKERERQDKRYAYDIEAQIKKQQLDNNFTLGGLGILSTLYR